nr:ABC transporter permease [Marinobacter sp. ATCH36]
MFLREAMARVTADRIAWFWLLAEPIAHVLLLVGVRTMIGRVRIIPGAEFIPWLVVGVTSFILFRNQMTKGMHAISANRALFAYRQVHPADTVLVRSGLEGTLSSIVMIILVCVFTLLGQDIIPVDPMKVMGFWVLIWLFGMGTGLISSVLVTVLPESQKFLSMIMLPLYFLSGVMIPIQYFPHGIREYLMYNPLVHAIEFVRSGFFEGYRMVDGVSVLYLGYWVVGALLLGLLLQVRFKSRLMSE